MRNQDTAYMKRIIGIIILTAAFLAAYGCGPDTSTETLSAENLSGTRWEGTLNGTSGGVTSSSARVTLKFGSTSAGHFIQKRHGALTTESYDFTYSVKGMKITFDCPAIEGIWEVSEYTGKTLNMKEEGGNRLMFLSPR